MAFNVNLYEFSKRSNSTLRPDGNGTVETCELLGPCNLMSPLFKFSASAPNIFNYMYVQQWDKYYWIDSWTFDRGLWEASCSIDPLASWRDEIGNMREYVLRSSAIWSGGIVDLTYPLIAETSIQQTYSDWSISYDVVGSWVVGIVGMRGLTEYYWTDDIAYMGDIMFGQDLWDEILADDPSYQAGGDNTFMKAQFNPLQYITSCMWFPFDIPHLTNPTDVYLGYWNSHCQMYKIKRYDFHIFTRTLTIIPHPQEDRGYYLNMAPYTRLRLSAMPWGEVDLDTTKFGNHEYLILEAYGDPVSGSTKLYVEDYYGNVILTLVGQIGVPEQLSQVLKDNLATVTGGLSALAGIGQMAMGDVLGGVSGFVSGLGNAIAAQYPDVSTTGTNGARIAVSPTGIWLTHTFQYIVGEDLQNHGRPLCERVLLRECPGYLLVSDPDVKLPATKEEIDKIKEFMTTGFYYE